MKNGGAHIGKTMLEGKNKGPERRGTICSGDTCIEEGKKMLVAVLEREVTGFIERPRYPSYQSSRQFHSYR